MHTLVDNMFCDIVLKNANIDDAIQESAYVDCSLLLWVAFFGKMDATPAAALIDVLKIVQATDSSGTGKKDVTGGALSVFTNLNIADDKWFLELDCIGLDHDNLFTFAAVSIGGDADNTDMNQTIAVVGKPRYKSEALNLTSAEYITNFKKAP